MTPTQARTSALRHLHDSLACLDEAGEFLAAAYVSLALDALATQAAHEADGDGAESPPAAAPRRAKP